MKTKRKGRYALLFGDWWRHPKIAGGIHNGAPMKRLSLAARGLWASLLSHAVDAPTDGMVTLDVAELVAGGTSAKEVRGALEELRRNGLVTGTDDAGEIHDFSESNITTAGWEQNKAKERDKKRAQRGAASTVPPVSPGDNVGTRDGTASGIPTGPLDSGLRTQDSGRSERASDARAPERDVVDPEPLPGHSVPWKPLVEPLRASILAWAKARKVAAPREATIGAEGVALVPIAKWLAETGDAQGWDVAERERRCAWLVERFYASKGPTADAGYPLAFLARNPQQYALDTSPRRGGS